MVRLTARRSMKTRCRCWYDDHDGREVPGVSKRRLNLVLLPWLGWPAQHKGQITGHFRDELALKRQPRRADVYAVGSCPHCGRP